MKKTLSTTMLFIAILMIPCISVIPFQVEAQEGDHGGLPGGPGSAIPGPQPVGVPIDQIVDEEARMSFRPNPIGLGQPLLVNIWCTPSLNNMQIFNNFTVYIQKPDGTTVTVGPLNSYQGDGTSWFEYNVDQVGTWRLKFVFSGDYYPKGIWYQGYIVNASGYSGSIGSSGTTGLSAFGNVYYKPASTDWQNLTVQNEMVGSWPPAALPNDYWTRPVSLANREWWPILGDWPQDGYQGGGPTWDALYPNTNTQYAANYNFHPWIKAPNTPHIVWKQEHAIAGLIGGPAGIYGMTSSPGGPSVIYQGRCYQTYNKPGVGQVAASYNLRTGQVYYEIPTASGGHTPTEVVYYPPQASSTILGELAQISWSAELIDISGTTLFKVNPYTGAVTNYSISPVNTGSAYNYFYNQYGGMSLAVQNLSSSTRIQYNLINWTTQGTSNTFANRVLTNTTYSPAGRATFFGAGVVNDTDRYSGDVQIDFTSGIWCQVDAYEQLNTTATYGGIVITAYDILSGNSLWSKNVTIPEYSRSDYITDHGTIAILTILGTWQGYDLKTGALKWTTPRMDYPWGANSFGAYAVASAYGLFYRFSYDGVYAFNWNDGSIAWHYMAPALNQWETPYLENGTAQYSFNSGGWLADGKLYVANSEHTPSWPLTRGWQLHCINATTGEGIWKIVSDATPSAAADGYLIASSSETGYNYAFGKGLSATTITAPNVVLPLGDGMVIQGTVLDESPAQLGTPCVSKESMTTQMQYLHMQYPIDGIYHNETIYGVPVTLTALDPNGNSINIGTVTSDGYYGTFSKTWTPTIAGDYKIIATFAGDDSYSSSSAVTTISIGTPSATATPVQEKAATDYTMPIISVGIGLAIIVVVSVAIATILILRKR
jgi:hypothetical protein